MGVLRRASKNLGEELRVSIQVRGHARDVLPMGLSPSPTDVDVYSNHGMHVLAHLKLEKVFGEPGLGTIIQNGSESEGGSRKVVVLESGGCWKSKKV